MNSTSILLRTCRTHHLPPLLRNPQRFRVPVSSKNPSTYNNGNVTRHLRFLSRCTNDTTPPTTNNNDYKTDTTGTTDTRQQWISAGDCLDDHAQVFLSLPNILGAYVGPNSLPPKLGESIMVAVNSHNNCPYCEGLHGELARMAGVEEYTKLQAAQSIEDCAALINDPAVVYARAFANYHYGDYGGDDGEEQMKAAYQSVVQSHGESKAKSVEALCWFLAWGSLGGNTLNSVMWEGNREAFPVVFSVYYAPLFGVIAGINKTLAHMPSMPGVFFQGMGVTLTFCGGAWLTPVGIMGLIARQLIANK